VERVEEQREWREWVPAARRERRVQNLPERRVSSLIAQFMVPLLLEDDRFYGEEEFRKVLGRKVLD
jgi:hypothetical protein